MGNVESSGESLATPYRREGTPRTGAARTPWSPRRSFRLNTDFSGSGPSGIGCLIRDHDGDLVSCCAERVGDCVIRGALGERLWPPAGGLAMGSVSVDVGEAVALLRGLEMARDLGYRHIVAETDHEANALSVNNPALSANQLIRLIREAKRSWFEECEVRPVNREMNRCANHLAGLAARHGTVSNQQLRDSADLQRLLREDKEKGKETGGQEELGGEFGRLGTAVKVAAAGVAAAAAIYGVSKLLSSSRGGSSYGPPKLPSSSEDELEEEEIGCLIRLNTDFSGSRPSGIGCLIRDHNGDLVSCCAEMLKDCVIKGPSGKTLWPPAEGLAGDVSVDVGEAVALLRGLEMARDLGYRHIVAETDHESNALCVNNEAFSGNPVIKLIREAKGGWFDACDVRSVKRDMNRCANHLAALPAKSGTVPYQQLRDSADLHRLIQEDKEK